jgi:hypothetical protein
LYAFDLLSRCSPFVCLWSFVLLQSVCMPLVFCPVAVRLYAFDLLSCCSPFVCLWSFVLLQSACMPLIFCPVAVRLYAFDLLSCCCPFVCLWSFVPLQSVCMPLIFCPVAVRLYAFELLYGRTLTLLLTWLPTPHHKLFGSSNTALLSFDYLAFSTPSVFPPLHMKFVPC